MRDFATSGINQFRITTGPMASTDAIGNHGAFLFKPNPKIQIFVVATEGTGDETAEDWEHVSAHVRYRLTTTRKNNKVKMRTPTWEEMCILKDIFWEDEDTVLQFHPPMSEYINNHPHCLHLWKPSNIQIPTPPSHLVGI